LIIPKTYGEPVAFLGVPNAEEPVEAVAVPVDVLELAELLAEVELLELLEPHPAATSPVAANAATVPSHFERFIFDFS
jgi:hypothetical protein